MLSTSWLFLLVYLGLACAGRPPTDEGCVTAVYTALGYLSFSGDPAQGAWEARCQNRLKVTSTYASADVYCTEEEQAAGFAQLQGYCLEYGKVELMPREQVAENLTHDALSRMPVVEYGQIPKSQRMPTAVLISPTFYRRTFDTIDTWQFEVWSHNAFGLLGYAFWVLVLAVGISHCLVRHIFHAVDIQAGQWARSRVRWLWIPLDGIYHWLQTHLVVPAPLSSPRRKLLWWTFPTRIEAVTVLLFWVLSVVVCTLEYRPVEGNLYWPSIPDQIMRYAADRTGVLSFANLPLVWLFAGRNNIFIWATGWSFGTFNLFHRHVAWVATLQAVAHTLIYLVIMYQKGNVIRKLHKPYLIWGTLATVVMVAILPFAMQWFRHRLYETFLLLHILFSIALLLGCFYHTIIFEGHDYWNYLWPAVAIWIVDRSLRLIRLIYCNIHVRANAGKGVQYTRSTATYDPSSDVIRLEVTPGSAHIRPSPGDFYYLYQPFRLTGWESHPFTLGAWSYDTHDRRFVSTKDNEVDIDVTQVPLLSDPSSPGTTTPDETQLKHPQQHQRNRHIQQQIPKFIFWIRPYDGWTRSLRQQCINSPDLTTTTTILLEGPYGNHFPLWSYESVLLIAGGTGIAAAVPYIQDHIVRSSTESEQILSSSRKDGNTTQTKDMRLIWVTRQEAFAQQVAVKELAPALARDDFRAEFYCTSSSNPAPARSGDDDDDGSDTDTDRRSSRDHLWKGDTGNINFLPGRPNLESLVLDHAHEAQLSESSAVVLVCGPSALADEARAAVHLAMRRGYRRIRYVEESFSW
ncbi:ferric reductase family protein [Aspergillus neoniger CBS 115656]|uniref:FRE family ferric-chelate reductase n=1 Tax=Aspergillus neoniger (strain CBS 115656) TaxID=1448310 RepID=A0A318YIQ8_ASPNB|nr:FRE family ferric-chelate reductase [Aspergillus neoniger CBS 115656]PYH34169.1 FRE family ferric-chelate reductase [Aspergillus neoniger CBS 115656]